MYPSQGENSINSPRHWVYMTKPPFSQSGCASSQARSKIFTLNGACDEDDEMRYLKIK